MALFFRLFAVVAISFNLIGSGFAQQQDRDPQLAKAYEVCRESDSSEALDACAVVIASKHATKTERSAAFTSRAFYYTNKREFDRAFAELQEGLRVLPDDAGIYFNLCQTRMISDGNFQQALVECTQAIKLSTDVRETEIFLTARGFLLVRIKRFREALADFEAALKIKPDGYNQLYGRGLAYSNLGDELRGFADIALAQRISPLPDLREFLIKLGYVR